ncbi:MAG: ribonuclease G [Pseudomonadota bacterium]
MSEEILINVTRSETRVAVLENGMLQELIIERRSRRAYLGNIYQGTVARVLPGMQAAFVDIGLQRAAFLHASDIARPHSEDDDRELSEPIPITQLLRDGQKILVQVIKDPIGTKGARLTTNISIPSRFLVLTPSASQIGVSVRIEDDEERERLRSMVEAARTLDTSTGYIVRTNAEGVDTFAIRADLSYLNKLWDLIQERSAKAEAGECVYEDLSLEIRALRDMMNTEVERVRIDSPEAFARTVEFVQQFMPERSNRIELYQSERPIFDLYGAEDDISNALQNQVTLKSGGHLVIDQTEAMTTIDVNTGGFVGHRNLEETIFKTNLEAAQAIARQLRLRNLGGIIIIDFIDMEEEDHREQVMKTLKKALAKDHARSFVSDISALGLVEMTRKRTSESLERLLCEPCPVCSGIGRIKSTETVCNEIFREITRAVRQFEADRLMVMAAPNIVDKILEEEAETIEALEDGIQKTIRFQPEEQYTQEQFDVVLF